MGKFEQYIYSISDYTCPLLDNCRNTYSYNLMVDYEIALYG